MEFNTRIILHVSTLILSIFLFAYISLHTQYYATMFILALLIVFQVSILLRYISLTNKELSRFFNAVKHSDFSQTFTHPNPNSSFSELGDAFNGVIERFRKERSDKEVQANYLQAFVQQIPIAVLSFDKMGRILVSNHAFRKLLAVGRDLNHLDQIKKFDQPLAEFIAQAQPSNDNTIKVKRNNEVLHLKVSCTILRTKGKVQKLVSILNIHGELEARELDAWQNLIRVMTHEIMNSITPITSLADTAKDNIDESSHQLNQLGLCKKESEVLSLLQDSANAISTIANRSQSLMSFVESYRTLTRVPPPKLRLFKIADLFQSVEALMAQQAESHSVLIQFTCKPSNLELNADPDLLEQAFINLIRNALEAIASITTPMVRLHAELQRHGIVIISVKDNGSGIESNNLENIFIPFFTTKRGGSGIGMSIVRQIIRLNKGSINVISSPLVGTEILMTFKP